MRATILVALAVLPGLPGCATTPESDVSTPREQVTRRETLRITNEGLVTTDTIPAPPPSAYRALVRTYEALEIPVTAVVDADQRLETENLVVDRLLGERMSRFLDCGDGVTGPRADNHDVAIRLFSTVTATEGGRSRVELEFDGTARPRMHAGSPIHCSSTRALEARLLDEVRRRAGAGRD